MTLIQFTFPQLPSPHSTPHKYLLACPLLTWGCQKQLRTDAKLCYTAIVGQVGLDIQNVLNAFSVSAEWDVKALHYYYLSIDKQIF